MVEFGDRRALAVLMSDVLLDEATDTLPACVSLHHSVSSSVVNMTVALASSAENPSNSSPDVITQSCDTGRFCYWQRSVVIRPGERLFITANKLRVTRGTVAYAFVRNILLTPGNCSSSDAPESKFSEFLFIIFSYSNFNTSRLFEASLWSRRNIVSLRSHRLLTTL